MNNVTTIGAIAVAAAVAVAAAPQKTANLTDTPAELVATYESLADGILAIKRTESNLVRSILASGYAHARSALARARQAASDGDAGKARAAIEELAALVAHLGAEGDNAVAGIRKRLLEGGHHHNALGEQQGIYDPGFVIVTRSAKKAFLDASRSIGQLAAAPDVAALDREWKRVEVAWNALMSAASK